MNREDRQGQLTYGVAMKGLIPSGPKPLKAQWLQMDDLLNIKVCLNF